MSLSFTNFSIISQRSFSDLKSNPLLPSSTNYGSVTRDPSVAFSTGRLASWKPSISSKNLLYYMSVIAALTNLFDCFSLLYFISFGCLIMFWRTVCRTLIVLNIIWSLSIRARINRRISLKRSSFLSISYSWGITWGTIDILRWLGLFYS